MTTQTVFIHEIKLQGNDSFTTQFNKCSDYWILAHDEKLSQDQRDEYLDLWFEERQRLELGMYCN